MHVDETTGSNNSTTVVENLSKVVGQNFESSKYNELMNTILKSPPPLNSICDILNKQRGMDMAPPLPTFTQMNSAISDINRASSNSHNAPFTGNNLRNTTYSFASNLSKSQSRVRITLPKKSYTSPLSNDTREGSHHSNNGANISELNKINHKFSNRADETTKINYVKLFQKFDVKSKLTCSKVLIPSSDRITETLKEISKECLGQRKSDNSIESQDKNMKAQDLSSADSESMLHLSQSHKEEVH
jgi:hypothetical protein